MRRGYEKERVGAYQKRKVATGGGGGLLEGRTNQAGTKPEKRESLVWYLVKSLSHLECQESKRRFTVFWSAGPAFGRSSTTGDN